MWNYGFLLFSCTKSNFGWSKIITRHTSSPSSYGKYLAYLAHCIESSWVLKERSICLHLCFISRRTLWRYQYVLSNRISKFVSQKNPYKVRHQLLHQWQISLHKQACTTSTFQNSLYCCHCHEPFSFFKVSQTDSWKGKTALWFAFFSREYMETIC